MRVPFRGPRLRSLFSLSSPAERAGVKGRAGVGSRSCQGVPAAAPKAHANNSEEMKQKEHEKRMTTQRREERKGSKRGDKVRSVQGRDAKEQQQRSRRS